MKFSAFPILAVGVLLTACNGAGSVQNPLQIPKPTSQSLAGLRPALPQGTAVFKTSVSVFPKADGTGVMVLPTRAIVGTSGDTIQYRRADGAVLSKSGYNATSPIVQEHEFFVRPGSAVPSFLEGLAPIEVTK